MFTPWETTWRRFYLMNPKADFAKVPVLRFPRPSRSILFGDLSEANGRETSSLGPSDPKLLGHAQ